MCVCTWLILHGILFNSGSLTASLFNKYFCTILECVCLVLQKVWVFHPPCHFLVVPSLNLPAVLFYYVFAFATSLNYITDLPLESGKLYKCRHGTDQVLNQWTKSKKLLCWYSCWLETVFSLFINWKSLDWLMEFEPWQYLNIWTENC